MPGSNNTSNPSGLRGPTARLALTRSTHSIEVTRIGWNGPRKSAFTPAQYLSKRGMKIRPKNHWVECAAAIGSADLTCKQTCSTGTQATPRGQVSQASFVGNSFNMNKLGHRSIPDGIFHLVGSRLQQQGQQLKGKLCPQHLPP